VIGILGGIGSGKSTAAREFAKLGCAVIDADQIAHELLDEPAVRQKLTALFGRDILGADGTVSRAKLGKIVFSDPQKLRQINTLVHPLVLERADRLIRRYQRQDSVKAIVLDMPLLMEVGWDDRCDRLVFIRCAPDLREKRARKAGPGSGNEMKIREKFQISLDTKASAVDNTIDNNSDVSALARQVANIFSDVLDRV